VYRSPDGDFSTFLSSLEFVIQKVQARNKRLILCGDWNINFMQESVRLHDMQELLSLHNLVNTVRSPTSYKRYGIINRCYYNKQG
jgi:exonuclease III